MNYRVLISTGEVSGDLQGSRLITALRSQAQRRSLDLEILALGGDRMAAAGATLVGHTTGLGSVGIVEALAYLWPSWQIQQRAKAIIRHDPPDLVVLIDYMGPNLSLARFLRRVLPQIPLLYYIAPQEWVWSFGKSRSSAIADLPDEILAIFPGEAQYYGDLGAKVRWMGHPLLDTVAQRPDRTTAREQLGIPPEQTTIALLPASRTQELKYLLPVMLEAAQHIQAQIPTAHFWVPVSQPAFAAPLQAALDRCPLAATLWHGDNALLFAAADLALTKSGTVNLELALQQVPQVVLYRVSAFTAWIAQHILRFSIPFASPPNLVLNRMVVPELLQEEATGDRIAQEALDLLQNPQRRSQVLADYQTLRSALGEPGVCDRVAQVILDSLHPPTIGRGNPPVVAPA